MSHSLISICIPTFNRKKTLRRLIESIVNQPAFDDEVSIVINDGPSSDGTEEMVREYCDKHSNIRYHRNPKAIWMLPALLESVELSDGKYTWLFGSDDFMHENALEIVKRELKERSPVLLLSNRFTFRNDIECKEYVTPNEVRISNFHGFADFSTYLWMSEPPLSDWKKRYFHLDDRDNYFTFMSVFCFDTAHYFRELEFVSKNVCSMGELKKHYFNYVVVLYARMLADNVISVVEQPILVFCQSDSHNWRHGKKTADDMKMLCEYLRSTYPISKQFSRTLDAFVFKWWFPYAFGKVTSFLDTVGLYRIPSALWRKYVLKR